MAQGDGPTLLADLSLALAEHDALQGFSAHLSWTHYRTLCRIDARAERLFYEIEAERNGWSQPELERQIYSHLYLRLLKCFVLVDLKLGKLTHQDVGQMDMYVRMYDDLRRGEGDNPTVGILLCGSKDKSVVRYSVLNGSEQLFASKYRLVLPSEEELRLELQRDREEIEAHQDLRGEDNDDSET